MTCCVAIILLVTAAVHGRPEGATSAACGTTTDIVPSHNGNLPSDIALPYSVDLSDFTSGQYIPGDMYTSERQCIANCMYVYRYAFVTFR